MRPVSSRRSRQRLLYFYVFAAVCVLAGGVAGLVYQQKLIARHRAETLRVCLETFATGAFRTCRDRSRQFRGTFKSGTDVEFAEILSTLARECQIVASGRGELENYLRAARLLRELEKQGELVFPDKHETWARLLERVRERVRYTLRGGVEGALEQLTHDPTPERLELVQSLRERGVEEPLLEEVVPADIEQVLEEVERLRRRRTASQELNEAVQRLANQPNAGTIIAVLEQLYRARSDLPDVDYQAVAGRVRRVIERHIVLRKHSDRALPPLLQPARDGTVPIRWPLADAERVFRPLRSVCLPLASGVVVANLSTREFVLYRGLRLLGRSVGDEHSWFAGAGQGSRWGIYRIRRDGAVERLLTLGKRPTQIAGSDETVVVCVDMELLLVSAGAVHRVRLPEPALSMVLVRDGKAAIAMGRSGVLYDVNVEEPRVSVILPPVPGATSGMSAASYDEYVVVCRRLVGGAGSIEVFKWEAGSLKLYGVRRWQTDQPWSRPVFARGCVYVATKQGYLLGFRVPAEPVEQLVPAGEAARLRPERGDEKVGEPHLFRVGADTILAVLGRNVLLFEPRPTQGAIIRRWQRTLSRPHGRVTAVMRLSSKRVALLRTTVGSGAAACEVLSLADGAIEGTIEVGLATVEAARVSGGVGLLDIHDNAWFVSEYSPHGDAGSASSRRRIATRTQRLLALNERLLLLVGADALRVFDGNRVVSLEGPAPATPSDCAPCPLSGVWTGGTAVGTVPGLCLLGPAGCIFVYVCTGKQPSDWTVLASSSVDLDSPRDRASGRGRLVVAAAPTSAVLAVGRRGGDRLVLLKRVRDAQGNSLHVLADLKLPGPLASLAWVLPDRLYIAMRGTPLCRVQVSGMLGVEPEQTPAVANCVRAGQILVGYDEHGGIWAFAPGQDGRLRLVWNGLLAPAAPPWLLRPAGGSDIVLASYYAQGAWRGALLSAANGQRVADLPPMGRPVAYWQEPEGTHVVSSDGVFTVVRHSPETGQGE